MKTNWLTAVVVSLLYMGCGSSLNTTYQGSETMQGMSFNIVFQNLNENGAQVTGTFIRTDRNSGQTETGQITGTSNGDVLTITLTNTGGYSSMTGCQAIHATLQRNNNQLFGSSTGAAGGQQGGFNGPGYFCSATYMLTEFDGEYPYPGTY